MIREELQIIKSGKSDLRKFGITVGIAFGLLGALTLWRGKDFYPYFLVLSASFISLGLIIPMALKPVHKVWMTLAIILGWFMTRVILTALFFVGFTPIGLLGRLFGKKFLDVEMSDSKETYWVYRKKKEVSLEDYEKQY